jgi:D-alanyl-D-alanine carboxypeptidase (penicillin-binding protein 5/6)
LDTFPRFYGGGPALAEPSRMVGGGIPIVKRILGSFVILWILLLWSSLSAAGDLRLAVRSAILMDMAAGRILFTHNADDPLPPASITKVLSLYLAEEAIRDGKVRPTDPVKISRKAGRAGGSKMFIQAGSEIPLEELLKGMAVVSANDASVAVAEYIGGNVEGFVKQMNRKASELGMSRSVFKNPNGLPARGQFTTARDMMILASDYLRRFPESLDLHSQQYYTYHDITQRNRNSLLRHYPNADGLKTGWVVKAGYHIVATAKRGNTRLIAVVMGAKTPAIRARETEKLLDEGFRMVREDPRQG